jgi:hypothetical protein
MFIVIFSIITQNTKVETPRMTIRPEIEFSQCASLCVPIITTNRSWGNALNYVSRNLPEKQEFQESTRLTMCPNDYHKKELSQRAWLCVPRFTRNNSSSVNARDYVSQWLPQKRSWVNALDYVFRDLPENKSLVNSLGYVYWTLPENRVQSMRVTMCPNDYHNQELSQRAWLCVPIFTRKREFSQRAWLCVLIFTSKNRFQSTRVTVCPDI